VRGRGRGRGEREREREKEKERERGECVGVMIQCEFTREDMRVWYDKV
jgi:hypothetical protein